MIHKTMIEKLVCSDFLALPLCATLLKLRWGESYLLRPTATEIML